jgi:hypothetical protein
LLNTHDFKDPRGGGQVGSGDEQTHVLWGMSNIDLGNVLIQLAKISQELPYSYSLNPIFVYIDLTTL